MTILSRQVRLENKPMVTATIDHRLLAIKGVLVHSFVPSFWVMCFSSNVPTCRDPHVWLSMHRQGLNYSARKAQVCESPPIPMPSTSICLHTEAGEPYPEQHTAKTARDRSSRIGS